MQENYDLFNSWKRWWLNKCFCANWMIYNKTYFSSKYWIKSVIESSFQYLFLRDLLYDFAVDYIFQDTINCYITLLCMQGIKNLYWIRRNEIYKTMNLQCANDYVSVYNPYQEKVSFNLYTFSVLFYYCQPRSKLLISSRKATIEMTEV